MLYWDLYQANRSLVASDQQARAVNSKPAGGSSLMNNVVVRRYPLLPLPLFASTDLKETRPYAVGEQQLLLYWVINPNEMWF